MCLSLIIGAYDEQTSHDSPYIFALGSDGSSLLVGKFMIDKIKFTVVMVITTLIFLMLFNELKLWTISTLCENVLICEPINGVN